MVALGERGVLKVIELLRCVRQRSLKDALSPNPKARSHMTGDTCKWLSGCNLTSTHTRMYTLVTQDTIVHTSDTQIGTKLR